MVERMKRRSLIRAMVVLTPFMACGCSWVMPHPARSSSVIGDADTPRDGRCSLAVAQDRRLLPDGIAATGLPSALIIHADFASAPNIRTISNGQAVAFEASTRDADPPRNYGPEMNRHGIAGPAPPRSTSWRIEVVDSQGNVPAADAALTNGSRFALREAQGSQYLRLAPKAGSTTVPRAEASLFIVYKADIPDSTRPTTCDETIRDEDFVFLRATAPSAWASLNQQGGLGISEAMAGKPASDSHSNPLCARQEERCRTDSKGGLICVSAPVCGE